jgi:hypothetical protein
MKAMPDGGLHGYLSELSPQARALLLGEFERRVASGDGALESSVILDELRALAPVPQLGAPALLFFRPLEPFLIDAARGRREPGRLARSVLPSFWQWAADDLIPEAAERFLAEAADALAEGEVGTAEALARVLQDRCAAALRAAFAAEEEGGPALADRIGPRLAVEDVASVRWLLRGRDMLAKLAAALPERIDDLAPDQVEHAIALIENTARPREIFTFALAVLMDRLREAGQLVRLGAAAAGSRSASRIAETAYGVTVDMVVCALERQADALDAAVGAGEFASAAVLLRSIDSGLRGLRGEMVIPVASSLGRQLAAISGRAAAFGRAALDVRTRLRA